MAPIKPYPAKQYTGDGSAEHLIHGAYGKTLKYVCMVKDGVKTYSLILKNKNDKIVFEAKFEEKDMLEFANSIKISTMLFKEEE